MHRQKGMNFAIVLCVCLMLSWAMTPCDGARILFLGAVGTQSYRNAYMPLVEELGKRGHTVISLTATKSKKQRANVTEVFVDGVEALLDKETPHDIIARENDADTGVLSIIPTMKRIQVSGCSLLLSNKYIKDLLAGEEPRPDIVFTILALNECDMGIIHRLGVPFVYYSPQGVFPWNVPSLRIANDITYCPQLFAESSDRIDFVGRLRNGFVLFLLTMIRTYYWVPAVHDVMKEHLGVDVPSPMETEKNYSLILTNSHFTFDFPRPDTPNLIRVGGMHLKKAQPLPQDLEEWMTGAGEEGVVYFSLGSSFAGSAMPEEIRLMFIDAFSKIPQRVLWKWEKDEMPGLPNNVKVSKWLPQQDILGHSNVRAFITQGGLLSTMETTYHGVPVVGIPIFGDQVMNMKNTEAAGAGIMLTWATITADTLVEALNEVMTNPKYRQRVKQRALVAKDLDMHPLDKAVYWMEYVIRHKGAYHLQHGALFLNDAQYYMLDMYLLLHLLLISIAVVLFLFCRFTYNQICASKVKTE